jgi:hypothetical protein
MDTETVSKIYGTAMLVYLTPNVCTVLCQAEHQSCHSIMTALAGVGRPAPEKHKYSGDRQGVHSHSQDICGF